MTRIRLIKAHALGNDFLLMDATTPNVAGDLRRLRGASATAIVASAPTA